MTKFFAQQNLKPFLFWNFFESAKSCWGRGVRWSNNLTFSREWLNGNPIEVAGTLLTSFRECITCSFTILLVNLQTTSRGPKVAVLVGIRWAISMSWFEISIPAALKRLINWETVLEADSYNSLSGIKANNFNVVLYLCSCLIESPIYSTRDDSKFRRDKSCLRLFADSARKSSYDFP